MKTTVQRMSVMSSASPGVGRFLSLIAMACCAGAALMTTGCPPPPPCVLFGVGGPTADAGPDKNVQVGTMVTLNGSASTEPDGNALSFQWDQNSGPVTVVLTNPNGPIATFVAPVEGVYVFTLTVSDGSCSDEDTVEVSASNDPNCSRPLAEAGQDFTVNEGERSICLDGSGSSDPNGRALTFRWTQLSGVDVVLSNPFVAKVCFDAPDDICGDQSLVFELTCVNTCQFRDSDSINVTVRDLGGGCCTVDTDCDDQRRCTVDTCDDTGACVFNPVQCDEGTSCDEMTGDCKDLCLGVDCDDFDPCTDDACDPVDGSCSNTRKNCGNQMCDPTDGACVDCLADANCDDTDACTTDTCAADRNCSNNAIVGCCMVDDDCEPNDTCNPIFHTCGTVCTADADCDDGLFCNGAETCDADASCQLGVSPCAEGQNCDEELDECSNACMTDTECGEAGVCVGRECVCRADVCPTGELWDAALSSCVVLQACNTVGFSIASFPHFESKGRGIAVVNLSDDCIPDVVVAANGSVSLFRGQSLARFEDPTQLHRGNVPSVVVTGDFDSNGIPDVAFTDSSRAGVVVTFRGNESGSLGDFAALPVGSRPEGVATCDLNGDDTLDIVVANRADSTVSLLMGHGDGTFEQQRVVPVPGFSVHGPSRNIVCADLDFDGTPDIVTVIGGGEDSSLAMLKGVGDGTFLPSTLLNKQGDVQGIVTADFNGDGRLDLATSSSVVSILLGSATDNLVSRIDTSLAVQSPRGLVAGDFDGDGSMDLAVASVEGKVILLLNNGDATFSQQTFVTNTEPNRIAAADLDSDGDLDIIVTESGGGPPSRKITVLRNLCR